MPVAAHNPLPMAAKTSVIIVTYHTGASLRLAVESTLAQAALKELVIVDNGNPEEMLVWLKDLAAKNKKVTLLTGHGNIGFGRACNLGAENVSGEFILLLNPDSMLPEKALEALQKVMEENLEAWAAGAHILNVAAVACLRPASPSVRAYISTACLAGSV
jgi:N-acetylglucosaminyl-diphospho-decaprenol L-rhamnosyltransferase